MQKAMAQDTQYRIPLFSHHTRCRICDYGLPKPFFSLGRQTLANNLLHEPGEGATEVPLEIVRCESCGLVQLSVVVDPRVLFDDYLYTPSQNKSFHDHFEKLAIDVSVMYPNRTSGLWVDIGSNDGLLLGKAQDLGWMVTGIEPAERLAQQARENGIPTYCGYWGEAAASTLRATVISATNVFAHVDDLHTFVRLVKRSLVKDGVFIIEVPYLANMIHDGTFDLIYHEHLSYFSLKPLVRLFEQYDMYIAAVEQVKIHGGSIRLFVHHSPSSVVASLPSHWADPPLPFDKFIDRAGRTKRKFIGAVHNYKYVIGYGAPAKATVLINYCGLTNDDIRYIVDDNPLKQGKYLPGSNIPVISTEVQRIFEGRTEPDAVVIFPWNIANDIEPKVKQYFPGADIIIPMPDVEVRGG